MSNDNEKRDPIVFTDLPDPGTPDYTHNPPPSRHRRGTTLRTRRKVETVWNARVAGATWRQAADIAGYTDPANARHAVAKVYGQLPGIERDELRQLWRDRLELTWREAVKDMADKKPGAVTAAVRVVTCAAALDGLNAPTNVNFHVTETFETLLTQIEASVYG